MEGAATGRPLRRPGWPSMRSRDVGRLGTCSGREHAGRLGRDG